jgi:methylenetetrahydrofolate--tRNA-(uracil-5-)-methyltransferase
MDSLIIKSADINAVESGGALAVDRVNFSEYITNTLKSHPLVEFINEEIDYIPDGPTIIATGPLTSIGLSNNIMELCGNEHLYFYDAIAPIILAESINKDIAYLKSRYDKGVASYYNCPMNKEQFNNFYNELINAEMVEQKDYEHKVFEGCMAVEDIARRGERTLLFGPMKPVGLTDPRTNIRPYAVVQLRQDDAAKSMYNIVGFQTRLKWPEQKRIIHIIPGLENAEIVRYGVMHRNTYINSPSVLNEFYQFKTRDDLFFAGQITGVEGYVESSSSGMVAGINMARYLKKQDQISFPNTTATGALSQYISTRNQNFVPMNVNFGIFDEAPLGTKKKERKLFYVNRSMEVIRSILNEIAD